MNLNNNEIFVCFCLGQSDHLKSMLENKHLRDLILQIDKAERPANILDSSMQIPIFTEFVDKALKIVEPHSKRNTIIKVMINDELIEE